MAEANRKESTTLFSLYADLIRFHEQRAQSIRRGLEGVRTEVMIPDVGKAIYNTPQGFELLKNYGTCVPDVEAIFHRFKNIPQIKAAVEVIPFHSYHRIIPPLFPDRHWEASARWKRRLWLRWNT